MFSDKRGKKVILVAHCILNQNAKLDECAHYPGAIREIIQLLLERGIGMIQMPCPELIRLGLDRQADKSTSHTVQSEDTRISRIMQEAEAQKLCKKISEDIVYQVEEYQKNGFEVLGLLGINGSPTCGVETTWADDHEFDGYGVLIKCLEEELAQRNITLNMAGIKANDTCSAIETVQTLLAL